MSSRAKIEADMMLDLIDDGCGALIDTAAAVRVAGVQMRFVAFPAELMRDPAHARISSFITVKDRMIHVVADQPPTEMRLAIAREVGRWILHRDRIDGPGYVAVSKRIGWDRDCDQDEAEIFASHLLAPDAQIRHWRRHAPITSASLGRIFGIPSMVIQHRIAA